MMDNNDKDIDRVTSAWLEKLALEEPSEGFSKNVMGSIYALNQNKLDDKFNFWWFLPAIPVLIAGGWYLSTLPGFMVKLNIYRTWIIEFYDTLNSGFGEIFGQVKQISISPFVILIFLAILSLLVIEDIFSKSRQNLKPDSQS